MVLIVCFRGALNMSTSKPQLTEASVEAAMDECERLGLESFLATNGFGLPRDYWVYRPSNGKSYPAKATVGVAHGYSEGGKPLRAGEFYGGQGEQAANTILRGLGYEIVGNEMSAAIASDESDADKIRRHALEHYIKPARADGHKQVDILVRDVNEALGLSQAWPNICQALVGPKFQRLAGVTEPERIGANMSSATVFRFSLSSPKAHLPQSTTPNPTNLILYGPPGTGKTYATAAEAVRLCGEDVMNERAELMALYGKLVDAGRIAFVTFHQHFSYEDFVEGLRPVPIENEDGNASGFQLRPEPGLFQQIAARARVAPLTSGEKPFDVSDRAIFKMSLGDASDPSAAWVFEESLAKGYALFGFENIDWSDPRFAERSAILREAEAKLPEKTFTLLTGPIQSTDVFRNDLEIGDLIIVSKGLSKFRAIGIVEGAYEYAPRKDGRYSHRRKVRWIWSDAQGRKASDITLVAFARKTIYPLKQNDLDMGAISALIADGDSEVTSAAPLPHVLIIDEINRANISKVFGELITLIEPDKRLGMPNALTLSLPYSKKNFGVPANLHIIGTMNTADRSIALLDTALRRRFTFREIAPVLELLPEQVDGLPLRRTLERINDRIEYLIDREHRIGHAFFMGCASRDDVDQVMRDKVIPLLQEYFFEDWSRIHAVIGDGFIGRRDLSPPPGIEGDQRPSWFVRQPFAANAYERLISGPAAMSDPNEKMADDTGSGDA